MKIIKRNGEERDFDLARIENAIAKASASVDEADAVPRETAVRIAANVADGCRALGRAIGVEEIQDMVEERLMEAGFYKVARHYVTYRYERSLARKGNTTDAKALSLLDSVNEVVKQENSNKNPTVVSVQRDYLAGEMSRDLSRRLLLPEDVVKAHDEGIIHFHDSDYFASREHNCSLVNLEDMLQNGTVISGVLIERPRSFLTACNIATQIIAQVASCQYGGQSISLAHLAPFVDVSRQRIRREVIREAVETGVQMTEKQISSITERRVAEEVRHGVQTLQYQVVTLMTTNGQAPFITVFMHLNEARDQGTRRDLAMVIEEVLRQRLQGVKNEKGVWITPAFPKLIYVLQEDNIHPGDPWFHLTELAARCTAKRMVPDYISEKIMKKNKVDKAGNGQVYPAMGCVDGGEVVTYRLDGVCFTEGFERMWDRLAERFRPQAQPQGSGSDLYMNVEGIEIYDTALGGFTRVLRLIRNVSTDWRDVHLTDGRRFLCTADHPFTTENRGEVHAADMAAGDIVRINCGQYARNTEIFDAGKAWLLGFMLCDGCYQGGNMFASVAASGEDDIAARFIGGMGRFFGLETETVLRQRGRKGTYKDLIVRGGHDAPREKARLYFEKMFEGMNKSRRHIPPCVFRWQREARLAFLAGMLDADGHIKREATYSVVQAGFVNKELALQQMALAQSLGMPASVYFNYYRGKEDGAIRHRVEFRPVKELVDAMACAKKKECFFDGNRDAGCEFAAVREVNAITRRAFSYDVTTESGHFEVSGIWSHNCRSFLTPYIDENGKPKYYGRFNQGVVTINLPDAALSSQGDRDAFRAILGERLELCHKALKCRHERLEGTLSDAAPILWQHGALARLPKGAKIDPLLHGGYSTISLGYAGLWECVYAMTGKKLTDPEGEEFGLEVMGTLNEYTAKWKAEEGIDYSLYGTPLESTTYRFAKSLQRRFGIVPGVTDRNYVTNSYHVHVTEPIDAFAKLALESRFQLLSPGGAISYVEVPDMQNNIEAVLSVMRFIYDHIIYAELNTKSDYCQKCGWDGEIEIVEQDGKLVWRCPNCGNTDQATMNVARRTCGFIGTQYWNQGRTEEIKERVLHL